MFKASRKPCPRGCLACNEMKIPATTSHADYNTATKDWTSPLLWWGLCNDQVGRGYLTLQPRQHKNLRLQKNEPLHPFDDPHVQAGQGTVVYEILEEARKRVDWTLMLSSFLLVEEGSFQVCLPTSKKRIPGLKSLG